MRLLSVALFLTLVWLQYELWLGKNGVTDYWQIEANVAPLSVCSLTLPWPT
ncbi:hypothetical protein [Salinivibrio kushneri]|uniref:hypothetical protein n=1 Tax=Salinivibrio kushneri TaxID=1908198 RepID=UPI0013015AB2|nr:hypothetical protein [Salinivibrio kushneri]